MIKNIVNKLFTADFILGYRPQKQTGLIFIVRAIEQIHNLSAITRQLGTGCSSAHTIQGFDVAIVAIMGLNCPLSMLTLPEYPFLAYSTSIPMRHPGIL